MRNAVSVATRGNVFRPEVGCAHPALIVPKGARSSIAGTQALPWLECRH
jgi:hypothetical protein